MNNGTNTLGGKSKIDFDDVNESLPSVSGTQSQISYVAGKNSLIPGMASNIIRNGNMSQRASDIMG